MTNSGLVSTVSHESLLQRSHCCMRKNIIALSLVCGICVARWRSSVSRQFAACVEGNGLEPTHAVINLVITDTDHYINICILNTYMVFQHNSRYNTRYAR